MSDPGNATAIKTRGGVPRIERKVLVGFLAALVLMFVAGTFTYRAGAELLDADGTLARSQELRQSARKLYVSVSEAESSQRGYLLTGRSDLRQTYGRRAEEVAALGHAMRRLVRDDGQRAALDETMTLAPRRLGALEQQIGVYQRGGAAVAASAVAAEPAGELMRALHNATERIARGEEKWLADREADTVRSRLLALFSLVLTFAVGTGMLVGLFRGMGRETTARARAEAALPESSADVTQRARQDAEIRALAATLARRTNEVEAVNKELEAFAYSVSHDLRAPLRHINGYAELLASSLGPDLGDEPRRYLGVITNATQQMSQLIEDLLAFSRLTRADMHSTRIDLRSTVDAAVAGLEMSTQGRNIEWQIGELPQVEGDPAMLKLVYTNLVGNAVKYTAPRDPAKIEIGAAGEEDDRAILYVHDNGVGFDMKYAGKLFGIFQRMHHPDEFAGTGIGLATVQRIVNRHGGRIWAEAVAGEGATFYFTLQKSLSDSQAS